MSYWGDLEQFGSAKALTLPSGKSIFYNDLARDADALSHGLKARRLVFLLCRNSHASVVGYLGFLRAGVVPLLLNNAIHPDHLAELMDTYDPEYLYLPRDTVLPDGVGRELRAFEDYALIETASSGGSDTHPDLALVIPTSGSTGSPKLVRLSSDNLQSNAASIAEYLRISANDRVITTMPMNYSYGLSILNSHLLKGASIVLTDAPLIERSFWDLVAAHQVTTFGGVPFIYKMLQRLRFDKMDLPHLRYLTQAGGKFNLQSRSEMTEMCKAKGIDFVVMYGQTEATARMSYLSPSGTPVRPGSIGKPIPGGRFWIENEAREVIDACNQPGELIYAGPNVSLGYAHGRSDLELGEENNGILRTGDLASRDKDGYYYIEGRKKRFLKVFGNRVNLDELESRLRARDFDVACGGVDDKVTVYFTHAESKKKLELCITEITGLNRLGFQLLCIEVIPRNEAGKILYAQLSPVES